MQIRTERLVEEFQELVSVDSVSYRERDMADLLKDKLGMLGIDAIEDNAGEHCGGNAGNIYGVWKGTLPGAPILFSAHMDTVEPGIGKKAILQEDGRITSDGTTVLGSDDAAGIAEILEAIRSIQEQNIQHRDIEVLFPVAEEVYGRGSHVFDYSCIQAKEAYVLDLSGAVGTASLQEPTLIPFTVEIQGKASHAGFAPEEGIHAIAIAADAIGQIEQGRIGEDTTVNIGKISGGTATNIVPEHVIMRGEIRSYEHRKAIETVENIGRIIEETAKAHGGSSNMTYDVHLHAYKIEETEPVVKRFEKACLELGIESRLTRTFGGSDNNSFLQHGIRGIVLACGMNQVHTTNEYATVEELERSASIVAKLMTSEE